VGSLAKRASFATKSDEKSVREVYDWVRYQVAPSLAFLAVADPDTASWLERLIDDGSGRLPAFRLPRAERFQAAGYQLAADDEMTGRSLQRLQPLPEGG